MASSGNQLTVTTQNGAGTSHSAINWQGFSIPQGNSTYFQQPNAASTVINRVVTNTPSQIFGTLGSNGRLVLVNQSGITVGAGAVVDTAGFTASALRMADADALAGRPRFGDEAGSAAGVSVFGNILARSGDVVLLGSQVSTGKDALIQAPNGSTILAAGQQIEITGRGLEGITLQVQAPADQAINLGTLQAGAVGMFAGTLRHSGEIKANTISQEGGKVVLKAAADTYVEGAGMILAAGTVGGSVDVLGNRVAVVDQAVINVSGEQGGGTVRVGGDYQGKNLDVQNANVSHFGSEASIKADATSHGDGGKVIVWADDTTRAYGHISAKGGEQGGNGGFIETSGRRYLDVNGIAVDTSATRGQTGTWLLDPTNIYIAVDQIAANGAGMPGTDTSADLSVPPIFQATGSIADSLLTTGTLQNNLANNSVTVSTANTSGYGGGVITVVSPVTWSNGSSLTLTADGSININAPITAASGTLNLNAGSGYGAAITQGSGASITASALTATAAADFANITLTEGNSVGTASFTAGSAANGGIVNFANSGALTLGNVTASGLTVNSSSGNGSILQSAGTKILMGSGGANFNAGSGGVTLMNSGNNFGSLGITSAGATQIIDSGSSLSLSAISAESFTLTTTGNVDSFPRFTVAGALSITSDGYINLCGDGCPIISVGGAITLKAAGDLTVGSYSSGASGDAITLISGGLFTASTLASETVTTPASGRWLLYLTDPVGSGSLPHTFDQYSLSDPAADFKQYNASFGTTPAGSGNGHLFSVAPTLSASLSGSVSKVYDGGLNIGLSGASLALTAGAIDGDIISGASLSGAVGALSDPNVGLRKAVTASGMTVSGVVSQVGNFQIPVYGYQTANATATIGEVLQAPVNLVGSRVYDGTNIVNSNMFSLSGLITGETLVLSGSGTVADKNVGVSKPISLGNLLLADGTGLASNYTFTGGTQVATITAASITAVSGITAANKVYDGSTLATIDAASAILVGAISGDNLSVTGASGAFGDKNAGLGKTVNITGIALSGADALNYTLGSSTASTSADISQASITAISGITAANKVYDGSTLATIDAASAILAGAISGDNLSVTGASGAFGDKNAGLGKTVNISALALSGKDAGNYTLASTTALALADISVRPLATWLGTSGNWTDAANWDALPDASNVQAVAIPAGAAVVYDAAAGTTRLQSLASSGLLTLTGGNLDVASVLSTSQYLQTAGALTGSAALNVNGSFAQNAGTINMGGAVAITQSTSNLAVGRISGASIQLAAPGGAITQSGALTTGLLDAQSLAGSLLNDAGNRVSAFKAAASGAGNIELTNTGVLDVRGIATASGNITLNNTGGISTSGLVQALNGTLSVTANSPLTVGASGVSSSGNITLTATNLTSAGNMTLNGPVTSTAGSISMSAANNLVQNSSVSAAGSVTASAGGSMSFGAGATTVGYPVFYSVAGSQVASPFNPVLAAQTLATGTVMGSTDFSLAFEQALLPLVLEDELLVADIAGDAASGSTYSTLAGAAPKQEKFILVLEGSICTP